MRAFRILSKFQYSQLRHAKLNDKQMLDRFQATLSNLFSDPKKVMNLAKTFRIFPSFFSHQMLDKMMENEQDMIQYFTYCHLKKNKINQSDSQMDSQLSAILQELSLRKKLDQKILQCFINYLRRHEDLTESDSLMEIFDIRNPQNWFGLTRNTQRKFIYHHGPTNSGKTFSAVNQLKLLQSDQKGVYMAPLRLLAWETQQRLGKCNLITGQQKDYQNSNLTSCTIEACKLDQEYQVAIVDEIQMLDDSERGWAWTNKILGLRAKRIHLCGDQRALSLISRIIQMSGGSLDEKIYSRLSKLHLIKRNWRIESLLPGDCVIDFSSAKLYAHRRKLNSKFKQNSLLSSNYKQLSSNGNQTAIIYGKMPPKSRKKQAQMFNKGDLPYLVASNAIGMGLNLMIRRIVFTNLLKMSSTGHEKILQDHEIRQIAGRAGRGMDHGYVLCSTPEIRRIVKNALKKVNITIEQKDPIENNLKTTIIEEEGTEQEQASTILENQENKIYNYFLKRNLTDDEMKIKRAALFFPFPIIERIKLKIEGLLNRRIKLGDTIKLICALSQENKDVFFIQSTERLIKISDKLQKLQLPLHYQFLFAGMPINTNLSGNLMESIIKFAQEFHLKGKVNIPIQLLNQYERNFQTFDKAKDIKRLQKYYVQLEGYTWLWNHLQLYFPHGELAQRVKEAVCDRIDYLLCKQQSTQQIKYWQKKDNTMNIKMRKDLQRYQRVTQKSNPNAVFKKKQSLV